MRKIMRSRLFAWILAAVLLCTAFPKTAYAVEQVEETAQETTQKMQEEPEERDATGEDQTETVEGVSGNDIGQQEEETPSEENDVEDAEDTEQAENQEAERQPDEESEETVGDEEVWPEKMTTDQLASARAATETIAQLKTRFPAGMYWNRVNLSYNNPDGVTGTPCPINHDTAPNT